MYLNSILLAETTLQGNEHQKVIVKSQFFWQ